MMFNNPRDTGIRRLQKVVVLYMRFYLMPALLFTVSLLGCGGSADLSFVSLHTQAIDPPRVEPYELRAQECYWWHDSDGDLCLAMRSHQANVFLGRVGDVDVELSFVLGKPPAGSGRDYPLGPRGVRTIIRSAMQNQRYNTMSGVMCVLVKPGDEMHGSFRIWMSPMNELGLLSFLPGKPGPLLCYGRFKAIKGAGSGQAILARTEAGAIRPPKAASAQPAPPTFTAAPSASQTPAQTPTPTRTPSQTSTMTPSNPSAPPKPQPTSIGVMQMVPSK